MRKEEIVRFFCIFFGRKHLYFYPWPDLNLASFRVFMENCLCEIRISLHANLRIKKVEYKQKPLKWMSFYHFVWMKNSKFHLKNFSLLCNNPLSENIAQWTCLDVYFWTFLLEFFYLRWLNLIINLKCIPSIFAVCRQKKDSNQRVRDLSVFLWRESSNFYCQKDWIVKFRS